MTFLAHSMDSSLSHSPAPALRLLILRLAMNAAAAALGALLFALVRMVDVSIQPWALSLATAAALGLLAGLYARVSLRTNTAVLRFLTALASTLLALICLGWMTWGLGGITLDRPAATGPDWFGLTQFGIATLGVALAQEAWKRERRPGEALRAPSPRQEVSSAAPEAALATAAGRSASRQTQGPTVPERRGLAAALAPLGAAWRRLRGPERVHIRLGGVAEHRCPYCLDQIRRRDPRGVVVCPVCRTPHHADCWAVTGMCQIPHHNR
jgi:hypothetical protein